MKIEILDEQARVCIVDADFTKADWGWWAYRKVSPQTDILYRVPIMGFAFYQLGGSTYCETVDFNGERVDYIQAYTTPDNRLLDPFFTDSGDFTGKLYSKETGDLVFSVDGCYVKPNPDMNVSAIPRKE